MIQVRCRGYKNKNCGQPAVAHNLCKSCLGSKFEDDVADLFRLMGFNVERNKYVVGRQVDIWVQFIQGVVRINGLVECKYLTEKNCGMEGVNQAAATSGPLLKNRSIDKAYLVTTKGFAPTAKASAEENGIECYTYDELLSRLIDFGPYLRKTIQEFEADPLYHTYVDLNCQRFLSLGKASSQGRGVTNRETGWQPVKKTLKHYVKGWLRLAHSNHLSIWGDFGSGKTSFCKYFAYLAAKWHMMDPIRFPRIPLLVRLGNYARLENGSVQAMMTDFLVNECGIQTSFEAFQKFMSAGRLLLLLDGFDEMAMRVDTKTRKRNFEVLAELALPSNKVIVTGRTGYFPTFQDMRRILGHAAESVDVYDKVMQHLEEEIRRRPVYGILSICPFSSRQIDRFLIKQGERLRELGCDDWHLLREVINRSYGLGDLARRPVLLDIIVQTIPRLQTALATLNMFKLYEIYTDFWLKRDWAKGEMRQLLTSEERLLFMQELAIQLYSTNEHNIHFSLLPERVQNYFNIAKKSELDYFEHDVRTCTFLDRTEDGYYKFIHKTFLEYFTARKLVKDLRNNWAAPFSELHLSNEVVSLISQCIQDEDLQTLLRWLSVDQPAKLWENVLTIYSAKKGRRFVGLNLRGAPLDGVELDGYTFEECNLDGASFRRAHLSGARFLSCSLKHADFRQAIFSDLSRLVKGSGCHFSQSILEHANFQGQMLRDSTFIDVDLSKANLKKTAFDRCTLERCDFRRTNLYRAVFAGCNLRQVHFLRAYMKKAKIIAFKTSRRITPYRSRKKEVRSILTAAKFEGCNLCQSKIIGAIFKEAVIASTSLQQANLIGVTLIGGRLSEVNLKDAKIIGTSFVDTTLKDIQCQDAYIVRSNFEALLK